MANKEQNICDLLEFFMIWYIFKKFKSKYTKIMWQQWLKNVKTLKKISDVGDFEAKLVLCFYPWASEGYWTRAGYHGEEIVDGLSGAD